MFHFNLKFEKLYFPPSSSGPHQIQIRYKSLCVICRFTPRQFPCLTQKIIPPSNFYFPYVQLISIFLAMECFIPIPLLSFPEHSHPYIFTPSSPSHHPLDPYCLYQDSSVSVGWPTKLPRTLSYSLSSPSQVSLFPLEYWS